MKEFGLPTLDATLGTTKSVSAPEPTPVQTATQKVSDDDQPTKKSDEDNQTAKLTAEVVTEDSGDGHVSNEDSEGSGEIVEETEEPHSQSATKVQSKSVRGTLHADGEATIKLPTRRAGHGESRYTLLTLKPTVCHKLQLRALDIANSLCFITPLVDFSFI